MRVLVVIGTRPEAIKLAPVVRALHADPGVTPEVCITSQHRDLLQPMLRFFDIKPEHDLKVMTPGQSLSEVTSRILNGMNGLLENGSYDWIIVQGDTTTAFTAALSGLYQRVKVAHVEAGLRSFDLANPFPEEANRRFIDVFADVMFVPTAESRTNLLREGAEPSRIFVTGNTGIDALLWTKGVVEQERRSLPFDLPTGQKLVLVTAHRRESFGEPLKRVFQTLLELTNQRPDVEVFFPMHPNPNVRALAKELLEDKPRIHLGEPLEYPDFVKAMAASDVILTDSGGVQEEAPALGKTVLVMRETTERPEGVEVGASELVGTNCELILERACYHLNLASTERPPNYVYGDGNASQRIVTALQNDYIAKLSRKAA